MQYIFFLGRQADLSILELEAALGAGAILKFNNKYAFIDLKEGLAEDQIDRLGGTQSIAKIVAKEPAEANLQKQILNLISSYVSGYIRDQKKDKLKLGLSIYGAKKIDQPGSKFARGVLAELRSELKESNPDLNLRTVDLKNSSAGSSAGSAVLSSAQVIHAGLLKSSGLALNLILDGGEVALAKTEQVQNLKRYSLRDRGKPRPDARNGMLPPKLAQILLSLSGLSKGQTVLDPFCGSGTVLQEALLIGLEAEGSDLNSEIVEDAKMNLEWLEHRFKLKGAKWSLLAGLDATKAKWDFKFNAVATEMFLGRPLGRLPAMKELLEIRRGCDTILSGFLRNLGQQVEPGFRAVLAVPCWNLGAGKVLDLESLEKLDHLGYNLVKFKKSDRSNSSTLYMRPGQTVGRRILVLDKK